jgi:hypothetical protein
MIKNLNPNAPTRQEINVPIRTIVFKSLILKRIEGKEKPGHPQSGAGSSQGDEALNWVMRSETNTDQGARK